MAIIYSHSRLSTFEKCALKYKFRYIDKIIPKIEKSIEAHLGKIVHDTLEWLYLSVKKEIIPSIDEIITYYAEKWQEKYKPDIVIVKNHLTEKDYFNKGVEFIINYYQMHQPFDDNTLELEKRIIIDLDKEGKYKIQGFIDRLSYNLKTKEYEVHDYKTGNSLPTQKDIDTDRQLALYAIAIKNIFGEDKEICLVWHYLAHDTKICSRRTNQQLEQLKKQTIELIKEIESTTIFPYNKTILCNWCEYQDICPSFGNKYPKGEKQETLNN